MYILLRGRLRRTTLLAIMAQAAPEIPVRQPIKVEESKPNILTTVIRRLEAATSRLEDIASTSVGFDAAAPGQNVGASAGATAQPTQSTAVPSKAVDSLPPSIQAFDKLLDTELKEWLELSAKLGDVINGQVRCAHGGFSNTRLI